ncbi:hypothetical protein [Rummeliibacillus suwonensis]|uniref:hypothetical protein n=1 Tax=Rummeliibacillus suwonensis TaxID=1306154 RepID=UPI0011B6B185|nr:hypothetical protein [Rummeliibacillus suwonensis]
MRTLSFKDNPFSDTFGATNVAMIEELNSETIAEMPLEELVEFLQEKGKSTLQKPRKSQNISKNHSELVLFG